MGHLGAVGLDGNLIKFHGTVQMYVKPCWDVLLLEDFERAGKPGAVTRTVGDGTSAPVKDGVSEVGVYAGSFRATGLACHSQ